MIRIIFILILLLIPFNTSIYANNCNYDFIEIELDIAKPEFDFKDGYIRINFENSNGFFLSPIMRILIKDISSLIPNFNIYVYNFIFSIHFRKSLQASFAHSSRELGCKDDGFNKQFDSKVNHFDIFSHN